MIDVLLGVVGLAMLVGLWVLAGALGRERMDPRTRSRWDAAFDRESRALRRTDATGVLMCRTCGASGSEKAGTCPRCGAAL